MLKGQILLSATVFALGLSACGDNGGGDANVCSSTNPAGTCPAGQYCDSGACVADAINVTVSGTLSVHPVSYGMAGPAATIGEGVAIALIDPTVLIFRGAAFDPAQESLAVIPIADADCSTDPTTGPVCTFSASGVDIGGMSSGFIALVMDDRGPSAHFVPTIVGFANRRTVSAHQASAEDFTDVSLLAVTESSLDVLSQLTAGETPTTMLEKGTLLGLAVDAAGAPVAGVTVALNPPTPALIYPNANLDGVIAGGPTADDGFFFTVAEPVDDRQTVTIWSADATGGGLTWPHVEQIGANRGNVFVFRYEANP